MLNEEGTILDEVGTNLTTQYRHQLDHLDDMFARIALRGILDYGLATPVSLTEQDYQRDAALVNWIASMGWAEKVQVQQDDQPWCIVKGGRYE